jgi:hypothetical protein
MKLDDMKKRMIGRVVGRLTVDYFAGKDFRDQRIWSCRCSCGKSTLLSTSELNLGNIKSCGCFRLELSAARLAEFNRTHGASKSKLYRTWVNIRSICRNPKAPGYKYTGALGIRVCKEWDEDFVVFQKWALDHGWEESKRLARMDRSKDYTPENCLCLSPDDARALRRETTETRRAR